MGSMVWTSDEARYLKAIFSWQDRFDDEQDGGNRVQTAAARSCIGDFRVLLIGAKGVGKTALLTRVCITQSALCSSTRFSLTTHRV